MKLIATSLLAGMLAFTLPAYAEEKKEEPPVKTVCIDVQGRDGKPVIDPKTKKTKQNCVKVKVRKKFEGTAIEDAKKK